MIHISAYMHMLPAVIMITAIGIGLYFMMNKKHAFERLNGASLSLVTLLGLCAYEILFWITA